MLKEVNELHGWKTPRTKKVLGRLLEGDRVRTEVIFLFNEKRVDSLGDLETEIHNGSRLVVLPAMRGGGESKKSPRS